MTNSGGVLQGIKVLEMGSAIAVPWAGGILADQGADVIKIEPPGIGDVLRYIGSNRNGVGAMWQGTNRGKRSIAIDITKPEGLEVALQIAADVDVVVHNFRPGVAERLGIGYEQVKALNNTVVYMSVSGFGDTGPYANKRAYDNVVQAFSGLAMNETDAPDDEPRQSYQVLSDKLSALTASQAITAALFARERGQGGQEITMSMVDACVSFLWMDGSQTASFVGEGANLGVQPARGVRLIEFANGWGQAAPLTDSEFFGLFRAFDEDVSNDPLLASVMDRMTNKDYVAEKTQALYVKAKQYDVDEAIARMEKEDVPCGKAMYLEDLPSHPQMVAMDSFVNTEHPVGGTMCEPRNPARFKSTPSPDPKPSPMLGEHTEQVLGQYGFSEKLVSLKNAGVY
mgnify:CR=1 FL=1